MTEAARGRLAVHAHWYQPLRTDPFSGEVPAEPSAAPFHDWNSRIDAECYRPNADRGNLSRISYDLGPTLASWMADAAPQTLAGFIAADRVASPEAARVAARERGASVAVPPGAGHGNAMAQAFHHSILPLASAADRRTEVRWGIREFELRFGRPPLGMWLPETAVDLLTLRLLAEEGIRYTILAPWQAAESGIDTRRPYRVEVGGGRSIIVAFYDAGLSGAVSFEPAVTADADRFARERVATRLGGLPHDASGLVVIATDGELYGHHQQFRDLFLQRLVAPSPTVPDRGFDVVELAAALLDPDPRELRPMRISERTSWSCHHGLARWSSECPDAADGRWKGPLRAALDRLAGAIDAVSAGAFATLPGRPALPEARDAWVDVVVGAGEAEAFAASRLEGGGRPRERDRAVFVDLLEAQRWRLAMFASDGWFWDDPIRPETRQVLRCAARAVRLVDEALGTRLEPALVADLALFSSPSQGLDGASIYRTALSEVGQPGPRP